MAHLLIAAAALLQQLYRIASHLCIFVTFSSYSFLGPAAVYGINGPVQAMQLTG